MEGRDRDLAQQIGILHGILRRNRPLYRVIEGSRQLGLPNYYIGAGCIAQTVWNELEGNAPMYGIGDIDLVYFDTDLSYEAEDAAIKSVHQRFAGCPVPIDVKNQARVHIWYRERFGEEIRPYASVESAISTWPATASAVGARLEGGRLRVVAPFGLNDLFSGIIRPNKEGHGGNLLQEGGQVGQNMAVPDGHPVVGLSGGRVSP